MPTFEISPCKGGFVAFAYRTRKGKIIESSQPICLGEFRSRYLARKATKSFDLKAEKKRNPFLLGW
jgi:hypothetical protein